MNKIKIFDSKTGTKQFLEDTPITLYNCGPTVYNDIHVGNLRSPIIFDMLVRFLKLVNQPYLYVHNITDIDDKIIQRAKDENLSEMAIGIKYTEHYLAILEHMNILLPQIMPKVSDNISGIIAYIQQLVNNDYGYLAGNDVVFSINKVSQYGELSKQNIAELIADSREANQNEEKQNSLDFVLWKKTNVGLNWDTPWSTGRPGWHSECSYFINKFIGPQVTIHGGGVDLKFPHHENENAQNYGICQLPIAKIWMHVGTITIDDQKMSKSLKNFVLVKDVLARFNPDALRYFFCQNHYRNPTNFTWEKMTEAQKEIQSLLHPIHVARTKLLNEKKCDFTKVQLADEVIEVLSDDLNLPNYLTYLQQVRNDLNKAIKQNDNKQMTQLMHQLIYHLTAFGFDVPNLHTPEIKQLITDWKQLLNAKNYQAADVIRAQLIATGVL
ncbi:cysteinyl-tRNA synthetase [Mycoplasmoides fastidiosum]|uniref:Cysteine--tRNA ligase n=1 Tax=Mycoplasmoides fastidiosum TaxID=92758 RepID=A0ABU0LYL3_9BACT|nr:cysteine--tRNA ligase [Mycoplasmoides fastidiosum]MDQ0513705.1 cysteinyl-tRNA synthetase [Mycoplasmoides fastidiosum]UUD37872.1 cysteine--tRNA ligase [Mycoplasmoides fastidiosum]